MSNDPFTIHVTRDGKITYPYGCKDSYEVQRIIEARLNKRYVERNEAEHEHQMKPNKTLAETYQENESKRLAEIEEQAKRRERKQFAQRNPPSREELLAFAEKCGGKVSAEKAKKEFHTSHRKAKQWLEDAGLIKKVVEGDI